MQSRSLKPELQRARQPPIEPPPAFRELVERYSHVVFRLAYRITGNEQDAEDAVQETFIKVHQRLDSFEARAAIGTWIYRVAANTAIDHLRRRRRLETRNTSLDEVSELGKVPASDGPNPERLAHGQQVGERIQAALSELSDIERAAFVLRHFEDRSSEEIGATLGISRSASKHAVFRAVKKLRKVLGPLMKASKL